MMTERIVRGMSFADYESVKALSASGAFVLSEECPARFFEQSPWNPNREPDERRHFNIGRALHLAVLEPDALAEAIVLVNADDYRTKAAQAARDDAYDAGKTPLLVKELDLVVAMDRAIHADPHAAELLGDGDPADNEVSFFWEDPQTGTPCKARADRISRQHRAIIDLKTAACAAPLAFKAAVFRDGHYLRAPWYLDGYEVVTGDVMKRYVFIAVEKEPPNVVAVYDLSDRALAWGRMMVRRSLNRFVECQVANKWREGYGGPSVIDLPEWAEYRLADREQAGDFKLSASPAKPMAADVRRGFDFLAP